MEKQKQLEKNQMPASTKNHSVNVIVLPPDGGWGWVIVGIGFLGGNLVDAVALSFPFIDYHLADSLKVSPVTVSVLLSTYNCLMQLCGPFASGLANRFGFKKLNFVGSFMYCVGFFLSFFINNYVLLLICYSIITGLGSALIYMVLMAAPGYWFEKKRSIAFGVTSGSMGATFTIIPIVSAKVEKAFGFRYVYFVLAALGFLGLLSSFLLKKPPISIIQEQTTDIQSHSEQGLIGENSKALGAVKPQPQVEVISTQAGIKIDQMPTSTQPFEEPKRFKKIWLKMTGQYKKMYVERPTNKKDAFSHGKSKHPEKLIGTHKCCPVSVTRPLKEMFDVRIMKNTSFIIIAIDTFLYFFCCYIPYVYLTKSCRVKKGIAESTGLLATSLYGIGISVSRWFFGIIFVAFPKTPPTYFATGVICVAGLLMLAQVLAHNNATVVILATLAGIFYGPWFPLRSEILVQYLGLDNLTNSMGLLFVIQALGSLVGVPVTEFFIGFFNEINAVFYILGTVWIFVGLFIGLLGLVGTKMEKELVQTVSLYSK